MTVAATAATLAAIEPNTLLIDVGTDAKTDPGDESILSFYHRVADATDGGEYSMEEAARTIMHQVQIGALVPAIGATPTVRTCKHCGCTDLYGCDLRCSWVARDVCSTCVGDRR